MRQLIFCLILILLAGCAKEPFDAKKVSDAIMFELEATYFSTNLTSSIACTVFSSAVDLCFENPTSGKEAKDVVNKIIGKTDAKPSQTWNFTGSAYIRTYTYDRFKVFTVTVTNEAIALMW